MKPKLQVSFSGGRTSAYMARMIQLAKSDEFDVRYVFANTGQEHPATYDFIHNCEKHWGIDIEWIEGVTNPEKGIGMRARRVDYESACRSGQPFADYIAKYGIPNQARPGCTGYLKIRPMQSYLKNSGWKIGTYSTAIGIRADEMDRMIANRTRYNIIYPLVEWWPRRKEDILLWFKEQPFDLEIEEHQGNCTWCWKKTDRKLFTLAQDNPEFFDFPIAMEEKHGMTGPFAENHGPQTFFRKHRSAKQILEVGQRGGFQRFQEGLVQQPLFVAPADDLDLGGGCEESCEVFTEETLRNAATMEEELL